MAKKKYSAEEIVSMLRQAEVHLSQGMTVVEAVRQLGIAEQTYYRWKKEYGGLTKRRPKS
jgi:putative transposase